MKKQPDCYSVRAVRFSQLRCLAQTSLIDSLPTLWDLAIARTGRWHGTISQGEQTATW